MQLLWTYIVSGLTTAAIYAIAATGLVLTYTTTGVFNFAHGGVGMMAAFTYWQLRFGWNWPAPVALIVVLFILAPLTGMLLEWLMMRRLDGTSDTTKLVVTLALMLATIGGATWIWDPTKARPIRKFWDGSVVTVLGVRLPWHQLTALILAGVVALGLRVLLTRTRLGVAMRACVDDRALASLNGARQGRVAMASWAIGTSLAALAGILISPTLNLSQLPLTLLIINAYAAAMIGRLRSLPMTFLGALILGITTDLLLGYSDRISKWTSIDRKFLTGFYASVPIVILFIVLLVLPQNRLRSHTAVRTREVIPKPTWSGTALFAAIVVGGGAMLSYALPKSDLFNLNRMWGIGIIGLSMIPLIGYSGHISLCQLSFAGIGMVVIHHMGRDGNPIALVWAAVVAGIVGFIVALPSLRLSGIYLALSTAAFAVVMDRWFFNFPKFTLFGYTFDMFNSGGLNIKKTKLFGLALKGHRSFFIFGAIAFALVVALIVAIRRSTYGQRLIALKDSPAACATLCMNPKITRLSVFTISAAIAGFGGAIYGQALQSVTGQSLDFVAGLSILMVMVIGGLNSPGAALFAGMFLGSPFVANVAGKVIPSFSQLQTVLVGLVGIGLGKNPNGFIPTDIRPNWNLFLKYRAALGILLAGFVGLWLAHRADLYSNWTFAWLCVGVLALAPVVLRLITKEPFPPRREPGVEAPKLTVPVDELALGGPMSTHDLDIVDRALALPSVRH